MSAPCRCSVCDRPCVREVEPAVGDESAVLEADVWEVVLSHGLRYPACHACWMKWPDEHKRFPDVGFGRWPDENRPRRSHVRLVDVVEVLRETAT